MQRGKVSFVEKARRAEAAGCVGVVIVQTEGGAWPYHMTDSTNSKPPVKVSVVMVSYTDGRALIELLKQASPSSSDSADNEEKKETTPRIGKGCLFTVGVQLSCPICREDFELKDEEKNKAARLPCGHVFHGNCIKPWITKQGYCPMCRSALPSDDPKQSGSQAARRHQQELLAAMYA
mmetsp:Transcript_21099/g.29562  ORF Transcript_21099/g.29562 Transcript_21099/m.29562 type:complete len:178 (+) Transcript_21099:200-733(+)